MDNSDLSTTGSAALPPPSYEEAVRLGLVTERLVDHDDEGDAAESGTGNILQHVPPLTSINEYKFSWLYPVIVKVKDALEIVGRELESMEHDGGKLGQRIQQIETRSYPAMIVLSMTGMITHEEGDPLTHGMEPWEASEHMLDEVLNQRCNENYTFIKATLANNMKSLRAWIQEQLKLDEEWTDTERPRVPSVRNIDIKRLKSSMYEVLCVMTRLHNWRRNHDMELRLEDYATDFLVKMDMEYLWLYLTRIADNERKVTEVSNSSSNEEEVDNEEEESSITMEPTAPPLEELELEDTPPAYSLMDPLAPPAPPEATTFLPPPRWQPPQPPPLSSIANYQNSKLYYLLIRLKDTIDQITKEIFYMMHSDLGLKINQLPVAGLEEMKTLALHRIMTSANARLVTRGTSEEIECHECKVKVWQNMEKLLGWIRPQQNLDQEWTSSNQRIPVLRSVEKMEMKEAMMMILNKMADLYEHALFDGRNLTLHDYASDLVLKQELGALWSLLTRVAEAELRSPAIPQTLV